MLATLASCAIPLAAGIRQLRAALTAGPVAIGVREIRAPAGCQLRMHASLHQWHRSPVNMTASGTGWGMALFHPIAGCAEEAKLTMLLAIHRQR